jgi:hypothetical protein
MKKLKNKKRLTGIVVAFMLTFIVGSAFAFDPGMLDIVGSVNVAPPEELYIVWSGVEIDDEFLNTGQTVAIIDARGRESQSIVWNIDFKDVKDEFDVSEGGCAAIVAVATNNSALKAEITDVGIEWIGTDGLTMVELGLEVIIDDTGFVGDIESEDTATLTVTVTWDGTIPDGFVIPDDDEYGLAGSFVISYEYKPAA